jgi:hypothetical protein
VQSFDLAVISFLIFLCRERFDERCRCSSSSGNLAPES